MKRPSLTLEDPTPPSDATSSGTTPGSSPAGRASGASSTSATPPTPPPPPKPPTSAAPPAPEAPGLGESIGRVRASATGLVNAHIDLLKEELGIIGRELGIIVGLALAAMLLAALLISLIYIGSWLFLGEWLFGSIGWGLLHGSLFTIALIEIIALELAGGWRQAPVRGLVLALILGILLAILFASNVMRTAAVNTASTLDPSIAIEPPLLAVLTVSVIGALVGAFALLALSYGRGNRGPFTILGVVLGFAVGFVVGSGIVDHTWLPVLVGGIAGGVVLGVILMIAGYRRMMAFRLLLLGATIGFFVGCIFGFVTFDTKGAIALAIALGLILWIAFMALIAQRHGIDPQKRYEKLVPSATIAEVAKTRAFVEQQWQRQRRNLSGK